MTFGLWGKMIAQWNNKIKEYLFFSNWIFSENIELQSSIPVSEMFLWLVFFELFEKRWRLVFGAYTCIGITRFLYKNNFARIVFAIAIFKCFKFWVLINEYYFVIDRNRTFDDRIFIFKQHRFLRKERKFSKKSTVVAI